MTRREYTEYLESLNNSELKQHAVKVLLKEQLGNNTPDWKIEILYNTCLMRDEAIYLDAMGEAVLQKLKLGENSV
jgi:hypothetical protein